MIAVSCVELVRAESRAKGSVIIRSLIGGDVWRCGLALGVWVFSLFWNAWHVFGGFGGFYFFFMNCF